MNNPLAPVEHEFLACNVSTEPPTSHTNESSVLLKDWALIDGSEAKNKQKQTTGLVTTREVMVAPNVVNKYDIVVNKYDIFFFLGQPAATACQSQCTLQQQQQQQ